ncbi:MULTISPECIES: hypothetical protein [Micromonospora]|uniref:Uncharacterized protein n=2 Tax=Micromonospora TaxID=1873 RepID=A0A9X0I1R7_9ACTN|nr:MULTISPECIES: hypothetical protein [Micromonospora]AEB45860.1 hypothetical protein VAB18032_23810 [Micromonospora maris AB-18-032]AIS85433.1 hypothetical protein VASRM7_195 [Verrucosispora sp. MS100047]KUJ45183.1 hypothetical protein ADL17_18960 [Micromonospora maris]RUL94770.1 hypothetical protein EG812_03635 [Verrucosispora sp. FIM060022]
MSRRRFEFRFDPPWRPVLALLGVRPSTAWVDVDADEVTVRFGPWRLRTTRDNVTGVQESGPYRWWRAIGPHLSAADVGVTFGSSTARGLCIRFGRPVPALLPGRWLRHPAMTVTVADPDALAHALAAAPDGGVGRL